MKVRWVGSYINTHVQAGHILLLCVEDLSNDMSEGYTEVHDEIHKKRRNIHVHMYSVCTDYRSRDTVVGTIYILDSLLCFLSLLWVHILSLSL